MAWTVRFQDAFEEEFEKLDKRVQDGVLAAARLLEDYGPRLGRPHADTLKGSKHANMKELRVGVAGGVWRIAFAFDPTREGILLVAGDKSGGGEDRFYKRLIEKADKRYASHLKQIEKTIGEKR